MLVKEQKRNSLFPLIVSKGIVKEQFIFFKY